MLELQPHKQEAGSRIRTSHIGCAFKICEGEALKSAVNAARKGGWCGASIERERTRRFFCHIECHKSEQKGNCYGH